MSSISAVKIILSFIIIGVVNSNCFASERDLERLTGFNEHKVELQQFDKARTQAERAFLEEAEQWENQRRREAVEFKKVKKAHQMSDDGIEAREDADEKKHLATAYKEAEKAYIKEKAKSKITLHNQQNIPSEAQELGLDVDRPRFDFKKRLLVGGKNKKGSSSGYDFGSGSGSGSSFGNGGFPSPPSFDDFGGSGGYVPAPNFPDDFGDIPPPPPPPMNPGFGDDSLGGGFGNEFSPPPPPPPSFGDF